jgi:hypothetical protein
MTETLINRLVNESGGKVLAAEIYSTSTKTDYSVKYFINGIPAGETFFSKTNVEAVEETANLWMHGVKNLYG